MAGALILNQYGVPGAWSQPEEDGGRKQGQGRSTDPQPIWGFQVRGLNLRKTEVGTRPERLSSTNMGVQVRGVNLKKTEAGTRPERLSSTNMGVQVRGVNLKKTEAGARPERLSSTNMGSQVRGVNLKKTEAGTRPERLSSTNMGASGAWCQPEEDGGGDKAGALILNRYGGPRCVVST